MYCNLTLMIVTLRNMALPCKWPNITPHSMHSQIGWSSTTTMNGTNVIQSAWWECECAGMRVCMCVVLPYTTVQRRRQDCSLPTHMVPSHCVMIEVALCPACASLCCSVVYCWSRLSWAFGDTLFDHTRQPLLLDSPGIAQYAIAHYTTMSVNSL